MGQLRGRHLHLAQAHRAADGAALQGRVRALLPARVPGGKNLSRVSTTRPDLWKCNYFHFAFVLLHEQWLELVLGWLSKVFASEAGGDGPEPSPISPSAPSAASLQPTSPILKQWRCHMHQFFCRIYVNMRIEELFSIIRGQTLNRW